MLADTYHQFLNRRHDKGTLIMVSSIDGMKAAPTPYGISKSFLNAYIRSAAQFYGGFLQTYGIAPGLNTTRMMNADMKFTYYRKDHPLMRCAVPQDIANLAVFMMSSYANIKE